MSTFCVRCKGGIDIKPPEYALGPLEYMGTQCLSSWAIQANCTCTYPLVIPEAKLSEMREGSCRVTDANDIDSNFKSAAPESASIKHRRKPIMNQSLLNPLRLEIPTIDGTRPNTDMQDLAARHRGPGKVRFSHYIEVYERIDDNEHRLVIR